MFGRAQVENRRAVPFDINFNPKTAQDYGFADRNRICKRLVPHLKPGPGIWCNISSSLFDVCVHEYGIDFAKPRQPSWSLGFGGHRCISQIMDHVVPERLREREMVVRYVSRAGQSRFHGGSHLKGSQSYPPGFGRALSFVRSANMKKNKLLAVEFMRRAKKITNALDTRARTNSMWSKHAGLKPVIEFLSKR
eukprot:s2459_g10.t1